MQDAERAGIETLLTSFRDAWHAGDIERWGRTFADNSDFITWKGVWWRSRDANVAGHRSAPQAIRDQMPNYRLTTEAIDLLAPTVALVHAHWLWADFVEGDAPPEDREGRITMVLVKRDSEWRIRALQNSRILPE